MFLFEHARGQRFWRIGWNNRDAVARDYRPTVEFFGNEMHTRAVSGYVRVQCPLMGVYAREVGQKRRVNID